MNSLAVKLSILALAALAIWAIIAISQSLRPYAPAPINHILEPEIPGQDEVIFCTMDAKICPDGSAVGRIAPDCEFAPCPEMPLGIEESVTPLETMPIVEEAEVTMPELEIVP